MIKFSNVRKTYKNSGNNAKEALKGVSFLIDDGEFVFIIGKSGSGKSMSALAIAGLLSRKKMKKRGQILFDGVDLLTCSRDHNDLGVRVFSLYLAESLNAVHLRHGDIHSDNIRAELHIISHTLFSVDGFSHNLISCSV